LKNRVHLFAFELAAQQGAAAAGVHHHLGRHVHLLAADLHRDPAGAIAVEQHLFDVDALIDLGAQLFGVLEQHQVELAAVHVEGVVEVDAILVELAEADGRLTAAGRVPRGAELDGKAGRAHVVDDADLLHHRHGGGDQRLAHVGPGVVQALKDRDSDPRLGQIAGQG
jgi:hypothetical protein